MIRAGQFCALKLYIHSNPGVGAANGPYWNMTEVGIANFQIGVPAKGKIPCSFDWKNSGTYSYPSGIVSASGA